MLRIIVKSFVMIVCCSIVSTTLAEFYIGLGVGQANLSVDKSLTYPVGSADPSQNRFTDSAAGVAGTLFSGYEMGFNDKWSSRFEVELGYNTAKINHTILNWFLDKNIGLRERLNATGSLFILPAYNLNDSVQLFVGPGVTLGNFSAKPISLDAGAGDVGVSASCQKTLVAWSAKAGVDATINSKISLQLSYEYMQFNKAKALGQEPLSGDTLSGVYQPKLAVIMLSMLYHF